MIVGNDHHFELVGAIKSDNRIYLSNSSLPRSRCVGKEGAAAEVAEKVFGRRGRGGRRVDVALNSTAPSGRKVKWSGST